MLGKIIDFKSRLPRTPIDEDNEEVARLKRAYKLAALLEAELLMLRFITPQERILQGQTLSGLQTIIDNIRALKDGV